MTVKKFSYATVAPYMWLAILMIVTALPGSPEHTVRTGIFNAVNVGLAFIWGIDAGRRSLQAKMDRIEAMCNDVSLRLMRLAQRAHETLAAQQAGTPEAEQQH